jgi:hypothetical protein
LFVALDRQRQWRQRVRRRRAAPACAMLRTESPPAHLFFDCVTQIAARGCWQKKLVACSKGVVFWGAFCVYLTLERKCKQVLLLIVGWAVSSATTLASQNLFNKSPPEKNPLVLCPQIIKSSVFSAV